MEGARAAGCRFENLERWSRFLRARADVRLTDWRGEDDREFVTLESTDGVQGLALLLPERVTEVRGETGAALSTREVELEGRRQRAIVVDLKAGSPFTLCLTVSKQNPMGGA